MLVAGASVRAAATSIRRAGFRPVAVDLFADLDLVESAETYRVDPADYPGGIAARVAHLDPVPWMYTGALENHPDLVADLSRRHPLCGVDPDALRAVRDPFRLAEVARGVGFPMPETRRDPSGLPTDGSWLLKPIASGGGLGIAFWLGQELPEPAPAFVWQRRLRGTSYSAIYLGDDRGARLVGVTRQKVARDFIYVGSRGPLSMPDPIGVALATLGHALVAAFRLRGIFGVDFVIVEEQPWLIEVNPRYSASVEVLELALGRSLVAEHLGCFGIEALRTNPPGPSASTSVVDKTIFRAGEALTLVEPVPAVIPSVVLDGRWAGPPPGPIEPGGEAGLWGIPDVADVPRVGTRFEPDEPILTFFSRGRYDAECFMDQQRRWRSWRCWFRGLKGQPGAIKPEY